MPLLCLHLYVIHVLICITIYFLPNLFDTAIFQLKVQKVNEKGSKTVTIYTENKIHSCHNYGEVIS